MKLQLLKVNKITGQIELETGLHIGAGKENIEIGGIDMPIVKDSYSLEPYIPGSSLKGKMRSMLEWKLGEFENDGKVLQKPGKDSKVARIFGHINKELGIGPTRMIVRDARLNQEQAKELAKNGIFRTEIKYENNINRITSEATPRQLERAISGLKFDVEIIYRIFDFEDDGGKADNENYQFLLQALKLVELDSLGGGGSRGNGKVKFYLKDDDGKDIDLESVKL